MWCVNNEKKFNWISEILQKKKKFSHKCIHKSETFSCSCVCYLYLWHCDDRFTNNKALVMSDLESLYCLFSNDSYLLNDDKFSKFITLCFQIPKLDQIKRIMLIDIPFTVSINIIQICLSISLAKNKGRSS